MSNIPTSRHSATAHTAPAAAPTALRSHGHANQPYQECQGETGTRGAAGTSGDTLPQSVRISGVSTEESDKQVPAVQVTQVPAQGHSSQHWWLPHQALGHLPPTPTQSGCYLLCQRLNCSTGSLAPGTHEGTLKLYLFAFPPNQR